MEDPAVEGARVEVVAAISLTVYVVVNSPPKVKDLDSCPGIFSV